MTRIYRDQPTSAKDIWNRVEYRPLEGFVFALTPFNFTSIAGNLPSAPAMMGNVVVWKPSKTAIYSAHIIMEIFREAGLPDGVINLIFARGPVVASEVFDHPDFAGFHFTGSTEVFQSIWKTIGENIHRYRTYPRIMQCQGSSYRYRTRSIRISGTKMFRSFAGLYAGQSLGRNQQGGPGTIGPTKNGTSRRFQ
jgi:1-pyrroline-5-carboxylate dehydrogenase